MSVARELKQKEWQCNIFTGAGQNQSQIFARKRRSDGASSSLENSFVFGGTANHHRSSSRYNMDRSFDSNLSQGN